MTTNKPLHGPQILADLAIRIGRMPPGKLGGLTDVDGVRVGHVTLVRGGPGEPPVLRTGVTAILPHSGNLVQEKVEAAVHVINGFGKSVGLPQVEELGEIESPILLTGTLNTWRVADALVDCLSEQNPGLYSFNPIVCECNDSFLSDELARPIGREHVFQAIREAHSGAVAEGCVGAGTGTSGFGFKAGVGTASRTVTDKAGGFTVGVLVQTNTGGAGDLRIDGVPVGRLLAAPQDKSGEAPGSIIIVVATNAPLSSRQLKRVAKRAAFGLARTGAVASHRNGDFVIAFSTTTRCPPAVAERIPDDRLTDFFTATIAATEEAIIRSILCAETTIGRDDHIRQAIPLDAVADILKRHARDR